MLSLYRQIRLMGFYEIDSLWESKISGGAENFSLMANVQSEKDRAYPPGP
jgi:hypothetical protein